MKCEACDIETDDSNIVEGEQGLICEKCLRAENQLVSACMKKLKELGVNPKDLNAWEIDEIDNDSLIAIVWKTETAVGVFHEKDETIICQTSQPSSACCNI